MTDESSIRLSKCFRETHRLRDRLPPNEDLSIFSLECEFKGDRQKFLAAGSLSCFGSFLKQRGAVWMSPTVLLMLEDDSAFFPGGKHCFSRLFDYHFALAICLLSVDPSTPVRVPLLFGIYVNSRETDVNDSTQYVTELLLALTENNLIESLSLSAPLQHFFEPLDPMALDDFLETHRTLQEIDFTDCKLSPALCNALGNARVGNLSLSIYNVLVEDLAALLGGLAHGRGPQHLRYYAADSDMAQYRWFPVNDHLESIEFSYVKQADPLDDTEIQVFISLIQKCRALKRFDWISTLISDAAWKSLLRAIQSHPALTHISFRGCCGHDNPDLVKRTNCLAHCLRGNQRIEEVYTLADERDSHVWRTQVMPLLRMNLFRKRLRTIVVSDDEPYTSKLMGYVLMKTKHDPNLVRCCLYESSNLICG